MARPAGDARRGAITSKHKRLQQQHQHHHHNHKGIPRPVRQVPEEVIVTQLLDILDGAGLPALTREALTSCFHYVKQRTALSGRTLTLDDLVKACAPLANTILHLKLQNAERSLQIKERIDSVMTDAMAATPTLDEFLTQIQRIVGERNGPQLQDYLVIEPPYRDLYNTMIVEIRERYPRGQEQELEQKCDEALPEARETPDGTSWTAFVKFLVQYFAFIRDVNVGNLLDTYNLLGELVQKCNSALAHQSMGIVVLPTVISYSRVLARLAIGLDKEPSLIAHLVPQTSSEDGGPRETLPERAANIIRAAFVLCLNDRSGTTSGIRDGRPDGKRTGIYTIANLCLKILFQCRKTRNAEQIFTNIYNSSPPLSLYPKSERCTYLYYLGRFLFQNSHFYRAQLALNAAYYDCHAQCLRQRRLILIYLIASNIILGRFPSSSLYSRPEAAGLKDQFHPLCVAITKGDLASFRKLTDLNSPSADWFLHYRILLQLKNRCEVLVWRSLARKTFLLNGNQGDVAARKAPTMDLRDLLCLAQFLERKAVEPPVPAHGHPSPQKVYADPDLEGAPTSPKATAASYPDMLQIESILSSLVSQGLLNGFISHKLSRFAIQGAKKMGGPLAAGFPRVWDVVSHKCANGDGKVVPGWKKAGFGMGEGRVMGGVAGQRVVGPGMVVNLSGVKPVGAG